MKLSSGISFEEFSPFMQFSKNDLTTQLANLNSDIQKQWNQCRIHTLMLQIPFPVVDLVIAFKWNPLWKKGRYSLFAHHITTKIVSFEHPLKRNKISLSI